MTVTILEPGSNVVVGGRGPPGGATPSARPAGRAPARVPG